MMNELAASLVAFVQAQVGRTLDPATRDAIVVELVGRLEAIAALPAPRTLTALTLRLLGASMVDDYDDATVIEFDYLQAAGFDLSPDDQMTIRALRIAPVNPRRVLDL
jgi:hypothetical protein